MKEAADPNGRSSQSVNLGRVGHPFDRCKVKALITSNEHHSTCLKTKVAATVGLGFLSAEERKARERVRQGDIEAKLLLMSVDGISEADEALNPLCENSWSETLHDVCEDYWGVGSGYLEVVRPDPGTDGNGEITGLYHIPAESVYPFIENADYDRHYEVQNFEGIGNAKKFARFGDWASMQSRLATNSLAGSFSIVEQGKNRISEIIEFRQPTALSRWHGYPDYLSCIAAIELVQCLRQYKFDFFQNRGVPEFLLFIVGQKLNKDQWKTIEDAMKANIGLGNSHKSLALNLEADKNVVDIKVEKLAMESKGEDQFSGTAEALATSIVTAHRVPPLLAGILIPGKLGATNELPNALQAFQTLVIGQTQRLFQQTLGNTLGNKKKNGGLKLKTEDFTFRRITEQFDMGEMDTISRMRQTVTEAKAQGRNLKAGVKKQDLAEAAYELAKQRGDDDLAMKIRAYLEAA